MNPVIYRGTEHLRVVGSCGQTQLRVSWLFQTTNEVVLCWVLDFKIRRNIFPEECKNCVIDSAELLKTYASNPGRLEKGIHVFDI